jgi:hypothetical protein
VGPRATHFTGYCCWFVCVHVRACLGYCCWFMCLWQHFTGHCCWFMWGLGQHTLLSIMTGLGIVVCFCGGPRATYLTGYYSWFVCVRVFVGATLYWELLLVYVGYCCCYVAPQATHLTGYCFWFMRGLGQYTLLGIVDGYAKFRATHFTGHLH